MADLDLIEAIEAGQKSWENLLARGGQRLRDFEAIEAAVRAAAPIIERAVRERDDPIPRYAQLDVWMALGGGAVAFERWRDGRTFADAWSELIAAVRHPDADFVGRRSAYAAGLADARSEADNG